MSYWNPHLFAYYVNITSQFDNQYLEIDNLFAYYMNITSQSVNQYLGTDNYSNTPQQISYQGFVTWGAKGLTCQL